MRKLGEGRIQKLRVKGILQIYCYHFLIKLSLTENFKGHSFERVVGNENKDEEALITTALGKQQAGRSLNYGLRIFTML